MRHLISVFTLVVLFNVSVSSVASEEETPFEVETSSLVALNASLSDSDELFLQESTGLVFSKKGEVLNPFNKEQRALFESLIKELESDASLASQPGYKALLALGKREPADQVAFFMASFGRLPAGSDLTKDWMFEDWEKVDAFLTKKGFELFACTSQYECVWKHKGMEYKLNKKELTFLNADKKKPDWKVGDEK
jgi:hypothetical protein